MWWGLQILPWWVLMCTCTMHTGSCWFLMVIHRYPSNVHYLLLLQKLVIYLLC